MKLVKRVVSHTPAPAASLRLRIPVYSRVLAFETPDGREVRRLEMLVDERGEEVNETDDMRSILYSDAGIV